MEVQEELECYLQILEENVKTSAEEMSRNLVGLVKMMKSFCSVYDQFQTGVRKFELLKNKLGKHNDENDEEEDEE